ncbi:MAG: Gfo/Idh/MocA family oxidoreductase [Clostridia bacterium]|nr:Gfo/Idh/MocA family oxidoreductase [Clostridia bacterium]
MRIAMLSSWHVHADGYAKEAIANGATIASVWDEIPERGRSWAEKLGVPFVEDYHDILKDKTVDGVIVCAPTNRHCEIITAAAKAGKHVFTEKVLALTNEDAETIRQAAQSSGIHFTISFPHETNPRNLMAKRLIDSGELGKISYARVRNCHSGSIKDWLPPHFYDREQCGGGAMIDLGAHPMYLLQWFLGTPVSVQSCFLNVTDRPVEDNAVSVIEFGGGAIGVSETGFVSVADPYRIEISGTKGYLQIDQNGLEYQKDGFPWTRVDDADIPDRRPSPLPYWIDSVGQNFKNEFYTIDEACALTRLMVAAYGSYRTGMKTHY